MKQIILEPNKAPQLIGAWNVGEVAQMAQGLLAWVNRLPLSEDAAEAEQDEKARLSAACS